MKLIVPQNFFGPIYVDTKNELGLGPFDFALIGPENVAAVIGGRLSVMSYPPRRRPTKKKKRRETMKNCDSCSGSGVQPEDPEYLPAAWRRCDDCGGTGEVKPRRQPRKKAGRK
jgi:hypothetical protein